MTDEALATAVNATLLVKLAGIPTPPDDLTGTYTLPIQWDNMVLPPPTGLHVRVTLKVGEVIQKSLGGVGNRRYRKVGVVIIEVYTLAGKGTADVDRIVSEIEARLCGRTFNGVHFKTTVPRPGLRDGKWWKVNVSLPFYCDRFQ